MNVQDPPMELVAPLDKNVFSQDGRKGKVLQTCVQVALLVNKDGPVVCKGYIPLKFKAFKKLFIYIMTTKGT